MKASCEYCQILGLSALINILVPSMLVFKRWNADDKDATDLHGFKFANEIRIRHSEIRNKKPMEPIDRRIIHFIRKHHIFTLATSSDNKPYTCTCFYVYHEPMNMFIFTSDRDTRHIHELELQPEVSGAIALETMIIGRIQGIQFTGSAHELKGEEYSLAHRAYLAKFPVALFKELCLWGIEPAFIKMTHNKLGFGVKLTWKREINRI
jgi:uncharacterized protein YhbP (UPF0306 family)